jgi:uncharacterized repeat protein (TIGR01451 family)
MGSYSLRQGPQQNLLAGNSLRRTFLGLVLGVVSLVAVPSTASAAADLSITKTAAPEPVFVGDVLTYTITVQNNGTTEARSVQVTDKLPAGVNFDSSPTPGCAEAAGTVTCNLAPLASTAQATVQIRVRPTAAGQVSNTAGVSSPDDPVAHSSQPVQTTVNPAADLAITATAIPDPVVAGDLLTYRLVVTNNGPSDATAITIRDTLPAGVTLDGASSSCLEFNGTVTCKMGGLASGGSAELDMTVRPESAGSIVNAAQVSSNVMDPVAANDTATVQTAVLPVPSPPGPGVAGPQRPSSSLNVVITGSYVLISGRTVKLVKGKFVPVVLTCAGLRKCQGTITVITDKPLKPASGRNKRKRRVARLGSASFALVGNRQEKILVPLSKSKVKLLRRLRRVKVRATIREVDLKGNPRISTRTFTLRAR